MTESQLARKQAEEWAEKWIAQWATLEALYVLQQQQGTNGND